MYYKKLINISILMFILILIKSFIGYRLINIHSIISIIVIFSLCNNLYKRKYYAWLISIIYIVLSLIIHYVRFKNIIITEIIILLIMLIYYKDFNRKTNSINKKKAINSILISILIMTFNIIVSLLITKNRLNIINLIDLLYLFKINHNYIFVLRVYYFIISVVNWILIIYSINNILKVNIMCNVDCSTENVRNIVLTYGQNPMSYLTLEKDKQYLFGKKVEGVVAYIIVSNVFVCCGDMICSKSDGKVFLKEILDYCKKNYLKTMFLNVTEYFLDIYKDSNFGVVKYGEDACFKLDEYNLLGKRVARVRTAVNRASRDGIKVIEYKYYEKTNLDLENKFISISNEWLDGKSTSEMGFMLGGLGLENKMDRRYFYAEDIDGNVVSVSVFLPYLNKKAYLLDITRYKKNAPVGVVEKIFYESSLILKAEGVETINMGLSPLYNIGSNDKLIITEKLFSFVYNHLNKAYGFKSLHFAKEKYAPTYYENRYIAYSPKPFSIKYAYSIVKSQNQKGIRSIILSQLNPFNKKKKMINNEEVNK